MAKWIQLPSQQLLYQPYQAAFWDARQQRICEQCHLEFKSPPHASCPQCQRPGLRKFHRLTMLSGRRGGKTRAGAIAGVEEATAPQTVGWACAPTNPKLERYVIPAFQQLIPPEWVREYSSENKDLWLVNGSLIHFQTLEDPDQGRGQGLNWLWIDEICELTLKHWEVVRPSLTEHRGVAFFTSSPRGYDWVWKMFFSRSCDCKEKCSNPNHQPGYWATRYATRENPIISEEELAEARATTTDAMYRQEYEADFVIFTGAVYGGLIEPQILRTSAQVQALIPEWNRYGRPGFIEPWRQILVGIDTGADHPFGAVKLVATERGMVVVGEYLERNKSFHEHAVHIKRLANNPNSRYGINKNDRQPSIELAQYGIFCQKAENEIVAGTERVKSWLATGQLYFVASLCPKTIEQLSAYRWAEPKTTDGQTRTKETVFKVDDDLPDALRYALMTWPVLPKAPPKPEDKPRDISHLEPTTQRVLKKVRAMEADELKAPPPQDVVGDFFL